MVTTEKIWNEFHRKLFHFINKRVKDRDIADDLLQEIFIKIHLKLHTLTDGDKLTGWVYTIARNSILDHFKAHKPGARLPEDIAAETETESFISGLMCCLYPFIETLPESYKDAILQTELGHISQKEYAEKLGISYSGAKSRVQRAREKLRLLFSECCISNSAKYNADECKQKCGC